MKGDFIEHLDGIIIVLVPPLYRKLRQPLQTATDLPSTRITTGFRPDIRPLLHLICCILRYSAPPRVPPHYLRLFVSILPKTLL